MACSRLGFALRQQQRLQQMMQADSQTLQQMLQTKRDWEILAGDSHPLVGTDERRVYDVRYKLGGVRLKA